MLAAVLDQKLSSRFSVFLPIQGLFPFGDGLTLLIFVLDCDNF
jgi:hypothetical protein